MKIQNLIIIILFVISLLIASWYLFGNSPTFAQSFQAFGILQVRGISVPLFEQAILVLILTLLITQISKSPCVLPRVKNPLWIWILEHTRELKPSESSRWLKSRGLFWTPQEQSSWRPQSLWKTLKFGCKQTFQVCCTENFKKSKEILLCSKCPRISRTLSSWWLSGIQTSREFLKLKCVVCQTLRHLKPKKQRSR